jgi:hypothetical protein
MWGEGDGLAVPFLSPVALGVVLEERGIVPTLELPIPPIPTTDQYLGAGASGKDAISEMIILDITGHNKSKRKPAIQRGYAHLPDCPKYQMLRAKRDGQEIPAQPDLCSPSGRRGKSSIKPARPGACNIRRIRSSDGYVHTYMPTYGLHPGTYTNGAVQGGT